MLFVTATSLGSVIGDCPSVVASERSDISDDTSPRKAEAGDALVPCSEGGRLSSCLHGLVDGEPGDSIERRVPDRPFLSSARDFDPGIPHACSSIRKALDPQQVVAEWGVVVDSGGGRFCAMKCRVVVDPAPYTCYSACKGARKDSLDWFAAKTMQGCRGGSGAYGRALMFKEGQVIRPVRKTSSCGEERDETCGPLFELEGRRPEVARVGGQRSQVAGRKIAERRMSESQGRRLSRSHAVLTSRWASGGRRGTRIWV